MMNYFYAHQFLTGLLTWSRCEKARDYSEDSSVMAAHGGFTPVLASENLYIFFPVPYFGGVVRFSMLDDYSK